MKELTGKEISALPTINELLYFLESEQQRFYNRGGWRVYNPLIVASSQFGLENPYSSYYNNIHRDDFIVNRLASQRYCCKPNLEFSPFLLRGEKQHYPSIISAFNRGDKDDKLISNLQTNDFVSLVKTHPLCRMFDNGINLPSSSRTFFFEMNYYGLAQHYNFNTGLIDFTNSTLVAAFFATTENLGNDKYRPITDIQRYPYGMIYIHHIIPELTFQMFSTVGHQIFPRSGAQWGFAFQENVCKLNINTMVNAYPFKHDAKCSQEIFNQLQQGKRLFPKDILQQYSQAIRESKEVSFITFAENLYSNPQDNLKGNLERCERKGITVNPNLMYCFTPDMLTSFFMDVKNGLWEQYCEPIHFPCKDGAKLKEELLSLPKNDYYKQFFEQRYYDKLFYHTLEDKFRAERKFSALHKR